MSDRAEPRSFKPRFDHRKSKTCPELRRRVRYRNWGWLVAIGVTLAMSGRVAEAHHTANIPRIGVLAVGAGAGAAYKPLQRRLEELGYIDGKNIVIDHRTAQGKLDQLSNLAAELVRRKVHVIIAVATPSAIAAKNATTSIPIVMVDVGDPVASGLITNLARPGGNITGLATLSPELSGKRVELLKQVVPMATRIAIFLNPTSLTNPLQLKEVETAAQALGLRIRALEAVGPGNFERAFAEMVRERIHAFMVLPDPLLNAQRARVVALAAKHRLPGIYDRAAYAELGGLMTYGANIPDLLRRAAIYVDKILKGAKPADLPGRTGDEVRAGDQSEDGETNWSHGPA